MTEQEKLDAIMRHFSHATFPDGEVVLIRATHRDFGFVAERPNTESQMVQVCAGYTESYYRIKFAVVHGYLPVQVDHKDGDRENDAISNLRAATAQQNAQNRKRIERKDGSDLPRGVYRRPRAGGRVRFEAACHYREGGKAHWKSLGYFDTVEEAEKVFNDFTREQYGEFFQEHPKLPRKDGEGEG